MSFVVILSAVFSISKASLPCNGIEYTISGITAAIPTDVCYSTGGSGYAVSYLYQCVNDEIYFNQYIAANCAGTAISTAASIAYASATALTQTCNLGACEYAKVRTYYATVWTDCSQSAPTALDAYIEAVYIQNQCKDSLGLYSESWSCTSDGSQITHSYHSGTGDCSGTATTAVYNTSKVACDNAQSGGSSGTPVYVTCDTASFDPSAITNTNAPLPTMTLSDCSTSGLQCKGVEWNFMGVTYAYPMDVCYSVAVTADDVSAAYSYWVKCSNGIPYIATYYVADCEGTPVTEVSMLETYVTAGYMSACCDLDPCNYVLQNTYTSVDVDCSDPDSADLTSYTGVPFVEDYCNSITTVASYKWSCNENRTEAKNEYFLGNGDCDGDATITLYDISLDVDCDDTGGQVAASVGIGLSCGTASFSGSDDSNNNNNNNNNDNDNNGGTDTTTEIPCVGIECVNSNSKESINCVFVWIYALVLAVFACFQL